MVGKLNQYRKKINTLKKNYVCSLSLECISKPLHRIGSRWPSLKLPSGSLSLIGVSKPPSAGQREWAMKMVRVLKEIHQFLI